MGFEVATTEIPRNHYRPVSQGEVFSAVDGEVRGNSREVSGGRGHEPAHNGGRPVHLEYSLQLHDAWLLLSASETQDRGSNESLSNELS
ncbi:hypothetical protein MLD38_037262 [Melastoma candidum]|uniref:Uncharacterized protein n=1 Tax=Melastoma candidum TaxID=119954 RepID=A0ACB9LP39_9MYRT|nr:hypothetical protein MLD38_037262 [Melastoma candidum]